MNRRLLSAEEVRPNDAELEGFGSKREVFFFFGARRKFSGLSFGWLGGLFFCLFFVCSFEVVYTRHSLQISGVERNPSSQIVDLAVFGLWIRECLLLF